MNRESEIAWVAGIFCGEGTVSLRYPDKNYINLRLTVAQSSDNNECPEMLLRVQRILGQGKVYKSNHKQEAHHKTKWQFCIYGAERVEPICQEMWDWLTPEKQEQIRNSFSRYYDRRYPQYVVL